MLKSSSFVPSSGQNQASLNLQNHIYSSFLEKKSADVALHIHGSWHAIYKLHRVVLIQAEYFRTLFTAGFSESTARLVDRQHGPEVIDIVLDDPNISRPAFELCISRLYGGGPPLHVSPSLTPTAEFPLTPSHPFSNSSAPASIPSFGPCPPASHSASPRFLLSLLATSIFLSIPAVASQALSAILSTIGPRTVIRYLNFASGHGIGEGGEEDPVTVTGLETIADIQEDHSESLSEGLSVQADETDFVEKFSGFHLVKDPNDGEDIYGKKEDPSEPRSSSLYHDSEPQYFYGAVSDKIGEAAVCWLARWGADVFHYEQQAVRDSLPSPESAILRRKAAAEHTQGDVSRGKGSFISVDFPPVWRPGGLSASWIRQLLSSDILFVRGEKERYDLACAVVEMRRQTNASLEDEQEWTTFFNSGIYYANMSLDQLMEITKDLSPSTGKPYVPLAVLQSAHWHQSVLQHHITSRPTTSSSSPPQSPSSRGKDLGLSLTTLDLLSPSTLSCAPLGLCQDDAWFFPVPSDSSSRIGDGTGLDGSTMDQLFEVPSSRKQPSVLRPSPSESNFFGLEQQAFQMSSVQADITRKGKWLPYPPLRFGVEFWDVDSLKEKSRLHSHTVWYAGSLWNVYVQVVRKKGVQLGVYLHRQSSIEPIPASSTPLVSSIHHQPTAHPSHSAQPAYAASPTFPSFSRSSTPHPTPSSPTTSRPSSLPNSSSMPSIHTTATTNTIPALAPPVMPVQPYRDPRPAVSAYFTIACASATGASLTRFTSAPDVFSVSQSWGWKSSSLRTEEYLDVNEDGSPKSHATFSKEMSLRATVILGVV